MPSYYLKNKEKIKKQSSQWKKDNKDRVNQCERLRRLKNPQKEIDRHRKYNKTHKKEAHEYYIKNEKSIKAKMHKYQKDNPDIILKANINQMKKFGKIFNIDSIIYKRALSLWSRTVKKLDNNMCKNCSSKKKLNAHHLIPKALYVGKSLDLDNGITLCEKCHSDIHGFNIY